MVVAAAAAAVAAAAVVVVVVGLLVNQPFHPLLQVDKKKLPRIFSPWKPLEAYTPVS